MKPHAFFIYFLSNFIFVLTLYPPTGDEVLPGSVLLPASRRGRYLANIVRRQAVDGTGIKFNKDADRMNAEAKKKVDVLSDELLPYIIAEQERRTTLYKRIMTAIQNGEKGITIAEIRNKPPLIIRKGLLYRCPANRAPKEPDGTGTLMCEEEIVPTQVMYDSCLSAEDKELYNADNKYFFCNRHKIEGPDLPRNGSTVIGCAPMERTSLNYTLNKCSLEDTNDVVVHYRYYPDRTYKFVQELDPDHEVCDHWNPCQIGYIYSLPGPDSSVMASELWRGYSERYGDYERDELVPQDAVEEFVHPNAQNYESSPRHIKIPAGYKFEKLWAKRTIDNFGWNPTNNKFRATTRITNDDKYVTVTHMFPESFSDYFYSTYYAVFTKDGGSGAKGARRGGQSAKSIKYLVISMSSAQVTLVNYQSAQGTGDNSTAIPYRCPRCHLQGIMVRSKEGHVHNIDPSQYRIKEHSDRNTYLEIELKNPKPSEYGDFFAIIQNADGVEERVKVLTLTLPEISVERQSASLALGAQFDYTANFQCDECEIQDVLCNGQSAVDAGRVGLIRVSKRATFTFQSFEDAYACVYIAIIKMNDRTYQKIVAVIERAKVQPSVVPPPARGDPFEMNVAFNCEECTVDRVSVNGLQLESPALGGRRSAQSGPPATGFYVVNGNTIAVRITEYSDIWEGVYQAVFMVGGESVTKTIFEIGVGGGSGAGGDGGATTAAGDSGATGGDVTPTTTVAGGDTTATEAASEAADADSETTPAKGDGGGGGDV